MRVQLKLIEGDLPAALRTMTSPVVERELRGLSDSSALIALAAFADGAEAGLAVGRRGDVGELLSLFVRPDLWGNGLGAHLLGTMETLLQRAGSRAVRVQYTTQAPSVAAVERLLQKRQWSSPKMQLVLAEIDSCLLDTVLWARRELSRPGEGLFPWAELESDERLCLESARDEVLPALWPWNDEQECDPATSVGLRVDGEVAGWMITHRVGPQMLRFTSLFVRERWRTPARNFSLLAAAGDRMRKTYGREMRATLAVEAGNAPMLRVLDRKFRPYALSWHELRASTKTLPPAAGS